MTDGSVTEEARRKRPRSGVFGIIATFSGIALILLSLFSPFSGSPEIQIEADTNIPIILTIKSPQFATATSGNVCDGVGRIQGIKDSQLTITKGSWSESVRIGSGTLNDQGDCIYNFRIAPPSTFTGGDIKLSAQFPFGKSAIYTVNVGTEAPWAPGRMELRFS